MAALSNYYDHVYLLPYMRGKRAHLKGVFSGGCVARGEGSSFRASAHAHTRATDPHRGWICLRTARHLYNRDMIVHELAHIILWQGHTARWRQLYHELGGTADVESRYARGIVKETI